MKRSEDALESDAPSYVGVNIGALSIKVVSLQDGKTHARVVGHEGRPLTVLERVLAEEERGNRRYVGVSGHLGHISEVAALQRALDELGDEFDAVASLGGESFLVYLLSGKRVLDVLSHNKCAAGSGEFFIQQIGRMGLAIDEAIERSFEGKAIPLASRCSVHCKSDITHKLNRQEAAIEDILHTLHDSMADKVVSLLHRSGRESRRLLLNGGVARNRAMVAALRVKLPETEIIVLPESPYLEAWGAALITRDDPRHNSPQISVNPTLGRLPPLLHYRDRVRWIRPPRPGNAGDGPFVLGVDAGSTTTKAVLMDADRREVVASHYGRTHGDPVGATKRCLRALAAQVGDRAVAFKGTTGSAREVVGAFLGTEHVYNEISAHAAGATHLDPDVDTIFEIGGQDSKYIYLRNGVPLNYAMNSACSAGTGSFLEESAQGDLGIPVTDIAPTALAAESPVQFKATCAAFINSDIRIALQEGCSREDVAAGLVYSIVNNYLTKVKGPRFVGKKVFLQGGVALNRAVGYAFAHSTGREVIIPPSPELLGAQGTALLAVQRAGAAPKETSSLVSLAQPEMKRRGRFTCGACSLFCTIDRFEVAGRRFPFGGRCSLFENVWKRKARRAAAPDLVEERAQRIFAQASVSGGTARRRIGVPRALTAHSLHPLYDTFLSRLGLDVVLSGVDSRGEIMAHSGFCYPAQIAHGAVLDLVQRGVNLVFFPHVVRMSNPLGSRDSYLCPITQASPYLLAHAFPKVRVLSPQVDFTKGYDDCTTLVDMAVELGFRRPLAEEAYRAAVAAQLEAERSLRELGKQAFERALTSEEPTIILVGRSYNAFAPDASQSVGKKLSSMGIRAIPADCLEPVTRGPTAWHFPNLIMNAVEQVKRHPNLFLLYVSNFSCTIDSFTHSQLASELGSKPYLLLETDAHTADGGIQTRLEAFLDIVRNYQHGRERSSKRFAPARLGAGGLVTTSSGEQVPLSDPRVRLHLPAFSAYHAQAGALAMRWLGLNPGPDLALERSQLERGLLYTSGGECLPLPICIGQLLQIHEARRPGEITGMYMLQGGAPCVADSYIGYFERFIAEHELRDTFVFSPNRDNDYCGIGIATLTRHLSVALSVADILLEIEQVLRVVGYAGAVEALRRHWRNLVASASSVREFQAQLPRLIDWLAGIPRTQDPSTQPRVMVIGDFFTRFSDFFMEGVQERYARHGIILKPVDLDELVLYSIYNGLVDTAHDWGLEPGLRATLKACTRCFGTDGQAYLARWRGYKKVQQLETTYRNRFRKTGLLIAEPNDVSSVFHEASKHISPAIVGEAIPTIGRGLEAQREGYDGIIVVGPFNCLPFRISEAILKPLCSERGTPILAYESDGYAVSPAFLRQVDVHIQQVLQRRHGLHKRRPAPTPV
jgi:predicted CoA-substrate-specific enzyme activase